MLATAALLGGLLACLACGDSGSDAPGASTGNITGDGGTLGALRYVQADLLDQASAAAAVESVDGLKAVVNLVGGFAMGPNVGESELEEFEFMLRLNLFPAFNLARAAMPRLADAGGGAFVCVSARAALEPFAGAAGYITATAGIPLC